MRRRAALLAFTVLLFVPSAAYARKTYSADRLDVELVLQRDGSMVVTETTVLRFVGGTFTRFSRRIPTDRTDGIVDITASFDGVPCERRGGEVRLEVDRDKGLTAIWHFAPVADSVHVFVLKYRALGVVERGSGGDVVAWRVIPGDRAYAVRSSIVKLDYPEGGTLLGQPAVQPAVAAATERGAIAFVVSELGPSRPVRVEVRFAPGSVTSATPEWQARRARGREVAPALAAGAGVILLSGFAWILLFWNSHRREPVGGDQRQRQWVPPGDLPAALAGALTKTGQSPVWADAFGAILGLARRGLVRVEASPDRTWYRQREFVICLMQLKDGPRPHERALLDLLFVTKKGPRPSVKFSELRGAVASGWKLFRRAVLSELGAMGLVSPERQHTRRWLVGVAVSLVVVGSLGLIPAGLLVDRFEAWPMMLPAAVIVVGLVALIFASAFSTLSDEGRRQSAAWRAFFRGLRDMVRGRQPVGEPETFDRYLAYATSAGVSDAWARAFRKGGKLAAMPPWFGALAVPDAGDAADNLVAMLKAGMASTRSKQGGHVA
jgi:Predicted membrane protein (DUF2207) C-terminal domain/Predicted membrane protein (DUF2207) N-terminal domain